MTRRRRRATYVAVAALGVAWATGCGDERGSRLQAEFANAGGLRAHSEVTQAGVRVGSVGSITITERDTALVTMKLQRVATVDATTRARVQSAGLLGEKYIDLSVTDSSEGGSHDALIPLERTDTPVELDDVLKVLDDDTRTALRVLINESGIALAGRGADFNALLATLPTALDEAEDLVAEVASENEALGRLVGDSGAVVGAISRRRGELGRLVPRARAALATFSMRRTRVQDTVRESPVLLERLRSSLARLTTVSASLGPAADGLRRSAPGLAAVLDELPPFARAASPTLVTAGDAAPRLAALGTTASPVLGRLRPAAGELARFADRLAPAARSVDAASTDLLGLIEGWVRAIQVRDASAHLYRSNNTGMSPQTLAAITDLYLRPAASPRRPEAAPRTSRAGPTGPARRPPTATSPSSPLTAATGPKPAPQGERPPVALPVEPLPPVTPLLDFLLGGG